MTLTERWQNVYKGGYISRTRENREEDIPFLERRIKPTHYLKTYWKEDGVICTDPAPELIPIKKPEVYYESGAERD